MAGRRGVTMIEVVLAVALLSSVAAIVVTAYDGVSRLNDRQRHRIYAAEVAHRLILNYLLDPKSLPDEGERIPYGADNLYRHELDELILLEEESEAENVDLRRSVPEAQLDENARLGAGLKMITVRIYHLENRGFADVREPLASVTRIYSPIDPSKDDDILIRQVEQLLGRPVELPSTSPASGGAGR